MRYVICLGLLSLMLCTCLRAQTKVIQMETLLSAYEALCADSCRNNQIRFLDTFPHSGEEFDLMMGYHPCLDDFSLYNYGCELVEAFWSFPGIRDSSFYNQVISVTCGMRIEADAPNYWQSHLQNFLLTGGTGADMLVDRLSFWPEGQQMQFWSLVWSSISDDPAVRQRDYHGEYIRQKYPLMMDIYDSARRVFYDGVNFSSNSPHDFCE